MQPIYYNFKTLAYISLVMNHALSITNEQTEMINATRAVSRQHSLPGIWSYELGALMKYFEV